MAGEEAVFAMPPAYMLIFIAYTQKKEGGIY
jgi:hypothetical protein